MIFFFFVTKPMNILYRNILIYASAFGESHSYLFHQQEKHIDWMRIGAFTLDSRVSLLTEKLSSPLRVPREGTIERMLESSGSCIVKDIKSGIWIADLQLVRCPVCDLSTCDGTMQTLDVRHIELCKKTQLQLVEPFSISNTLNLHPHSWTGAPDDSQPKAMIAPHAVAVHTRLQENEGIVVKYQTMKVGTDGDIVSIRISQQLL
ncbi:BnaC04g21630D [Brassica napus]|uniref:BnaC04g21630D protein n=1 Tax=Brassica napus TaxID=3708 RepID=A0A078I1I3_BRANA|nr:BnaC04g21630D [Brassica napus]